MQYIQGVYTINILYIGISLENMHIDRYHGKSKNARCGIRGQSDSNIMSYIAA